MRFLTTLSAALFALLWTLNVPFYAGSTIGPHYSWRMEHGRLTVERALSQNAQSFWADVNTEGLRWAFEGKVYGGGEWTVTLPLWIPFLISLLAAIFAWRSAASERSSEHKE